MRARRRHRTYDHRLVQLVRDTGDIRIAARHGVPRATASGWIRRDRKPVVTVDEDDVEGARLRLRILRLEQRVRRLQAMLRLLLAVVRLVQPDLTRLRVPKASDKAHLLRANARSREVLGLKRVLRLVRLSPSRLSAATWLPSSRSGTLPATFPR